ncbi:MAG: tetratricopeptide repeat protein [Calditrichia bacterium]
MSSNLQTASTVLKNISQSVIAALMYDIALQDMPESDIDAAESIFYESIDIASEGILSSRRTKERMLRTLQRQKLSIIINKFKKDGKPVPDNYFAKRFSQVISLGNSEKIVPDFLNVFREKLAKNEKLATTVMTRYLGEALSADSEGEKEFVDEFDELFSMLPDEPEEIPSEPVIKPAKKVAPKAPPKIASPPKQKANLPEEEVAEERPDTILPKQPGSAQMIYWQPQRHALPVRGLRNLEPLLAEHPLLFITGFAGSGKSVLISAYIYQQVFNRSLAIGKVFYYRFSESHSTYDVFLKSIAAFSELQIPGSAVGYEAEIASAIAASDTIFVLDDIHALKDYRLRDFVQLCWKNISENDEFGGKFLMLDRDLPEIETNQNIAFYRYDGLAVSESSALLRDLWKLSLPRMLARQLASKLCGNPERMLIFRGWFQNEQHTDTELERFVEQMPESDGTAIQEVQLSYYVANALKEGFARTDSRLNSFCTALSIFEIPEEERFLKAVYDKIGGGDFQEKLEELVEEFQLLEYDNQAVRYNLPDTLRTFFNSQMEDDHIRRALHNQAGQLYRERYSVKNDSRDAVLGAGHFYFAEREEDAIGLINAISKIEDLTVQQCEYLLNLLKNLSLPTLETVEEQRAAQLRTGILYFRLGKWGEAETTLVSCLQEDTDSQTRAETLFYIGQIAKLKGNTTQSAHNLQEAAQLYQREKNIARLAACHQHLAEVYLIEENRQNAYNHYQRSLEYFQDIKDTRGEQIILDQLGQLAKAQHKLVDAQAYFERSMAICNAHGDRIGNARTLMEIARLQEMQKKWLEAIDTYEQVAENYRKLNNPIAFATAYQHMGAIYLQLNDLAHARVHLQNAHQIFEENEHRAGLAEVYELLAKIHHRQKEWELAMENYHQAQELFHDTKQESRYAEIFAQIARVYQEMGETDRALELFEKALAINERLGESPGVARIFEEIGDIYQQREDLSYAIDMYRNAMSLKENLNNQLGVAELLSKIGNIYKAHLDWEKTVPCFEQALDIFTKLGNVRGMAFCHNSLAFVYHAQKSWDIARHHYVEALKNFEASNDFQGMAEVNFNLGNVFHDLGDWERALNRYNTALPLFEETGDFFNISQVLGNLSSIEFEQKTHTSAIAKQVEILLYFQKNQQTQMVEKVLANLVSCHQELGADTFQQLLATCLEELMQNGVQWGKNEIISPESATEMIDKIFYNN